MSQRDDSMVNPHRAFLETLYDVAVEAAHPRMLVAEAVARLRDVPDARRIAIFALGKAAPAMAEEAVARLGDLGLTITGGVIAGSADGKSPHSQIVRVTGDHPLPGRRSALASRAVGAAVEEARTTADTALVFISGGATSLIAEPIDGISLDSLIALYRSLLHSGRDIGAMNAVRKRFLRWGAGRLATALAPLPIHIALLSDVIGDDPATIASGPCSADSLTAADVRERLDTLADLPSDARAELCEHLALVVSARLPETPKPNDPAFDRVVQPIVFGNRSALHAVAEHAGAHGWRVDLHPEPLCGEAATRGAEIAHALIASTDRALCIIHGGEPTVSLGAQASGAGGRAQELALAAARVLNRTREHAGTTDPRAAGELQRPGDRNAPSAHRPMTLLAAGTDGRDGATDAAGAIVDASTWQRIRDRGLSPDRALASHDSSSALAAADALLPARVTGTNVMDIVVGLAGTP
jgi:hydroxypyruvate reductase